MEIGLMIEGQNGLNWDRWQRMLQAAEELGFCAVFRSDHFTNAAAPDKDSLELWVSLTHAADRTTRIELGSMVTPVTFRHPAITARMAAAVDDLSVGRFTLGIGAGWQQREHHNFGIPFPEAKTRFAMLPEYLEVVTRLLRSDDASSYAGKYYQLNEAVLLSRPTRSGGPPILVGGNGETRTLPIAARYADEWNALFVKPAEFSRLNDRLDELLAGEGREPGQVRRSLMTGTVFAATEKALAAKLSAQGRDAAALAERGMLVGAADTFGARLAEFAEAGVERILLQWLDLDDVEGLAGLARACGVS